jgi:teichuronic acid biosynthesis glycosyltransferase TuaC
MRILTFTKLYPNEQMPWHGIFVARRVAALARACGHEVEVVAPVPYFPKFLPARGEWKKLQLVPNQEERA